MATLKHDACKGCGRPIVWGPLFEADGKTPRVDDNGKQVVVPLDPIAPVYQASVGADGSCSKAVRVNGDRVMLPCLVSHFATCKRASDFSRGGRTS